MSFIKQFLTALYRFGSYPQLINVKGIRTFLYTLLTVIFTVLVMTCTVIPGYLAIGGIEGFAKKYIPEFTIKDGQLSMDKVDFEDRLNGVRIFIDTTKTELDLSEAGDSPCALIASRDEVYVFNGIRGEKMSFKDMGMDFGSEDIFNALANKNVRLSIISFIIFMWFAGKFMQAVYNIAMLALIGNIINMAVTRVPLRFSQMLKLSAYARTLPLIMSLVVPILAGFAFNPLVFYAVGAFYMYMGLKNIKTQSGIVIADISGMQNN